MRTQQPHASRRDAVGGGELPDCFPGRGLCCPDDPLDLVLQLFPAADRAAASLGIGGGPGGGGEPPRRVIKQEPESPKPLAEAESACGGGGGGGGGWDSSGLSASFLLEGLWSGLDEIDVDMFFADDALDGGGGEAATEGNNLLCDPTTGVKPEPPAHATAGGPVHTRGAVVPNDASVSPLPAPMPAGASPLQAYDNASASPPATALPVFVPNSSTPPMPALIMPPAAPAPMPLPAAGLHACGAWPGIVSNIGPALPPPLMAPIMPARALHPNAAAWGAGVYPINNAPAAHAPPSATPSSSSPPSHASSGSGRCPTSSTAPEAEFLQPHRHVWVVPRKPRSPPPANRRKRPWVLDFPLHALPPVVVAPPPGNPVDDFGDGNDDDAKNRNAASALPLALALALPPPPGGKIAAAGGGIRRRRPAPRQRNRQAQRVCSHCHSPETPQWRAGPDGPGTLCNACGIRYAANRLLPEYRPSTAPSFRSGQHSNRHRKVMKLREQQMVVKAVEEEEKPSSEQAVVEDDRSTEKDDNGFMGVYHQQQACDTTQLDQFNCR